jgi:hypothetical protein
VLHGKKFFYTSSSLESRVGIRGSLEATYKGQYVRTCSDGGHNTEMTRHLEFY